MKRNRQLMLELLKRFEDASERFVPFDDFFADASNEEVHHLNLLVQEGRLLLLAGAWDRAHSGINSPPLRKGRGYHLGLNIQGHEYLEGASQPVWRRWWRNVVCNVPTLVTAVITALIVAWALDLAGPDQAIDESNPSEVLLPPE